MKVWKCTCTDPTRALICVTCTAAMIGYKPSTVYNKAEAQEIPSIALSKRKRMFRRETIQYWISNHEQGIGAS